MESLSATVDARDSYTAGHSRRVQQTLARASARSSGSRRPSSTSSATPRSSTTSASSPSPTRSCSSRAASTPEEWELMQRHAEEGARIIDRLGFLGDAVPAIRHHHERWDGQRLPRRPRGRGDPARRPHHPRRRRPRLDADHAHLPRRGRSHQALRRAPQRNAAPSSARAASPRSSSLCPRLDIAESASCPLVASSGAPCSPPALGRRLRAATCGFSQPALHFLGWRRKPRYRARGRDRPEGAGRVPVRDPASATPTSRSSPSCVRAPSGSGARRRCGSSPPTRRRACTRRP